MKKVFLVVIFLHSSLFIHAQYTDIINSKRPGFSESPYGVGTNVFQFESGLFYRKSNNPSFLESPETMGGELFLRVGKFLEKLEINAKIVYQKDELKMMNDLIITENRLFETNNNLPVSTTHIQGISELTIGAKYLIYQQEYTDKTKEIRSWKRRMAFDKKRLIPSVGIYAGVNTNFLSPDFKEKEGISYKAALLLQNDFSDRLVLLTNLIADKISLESKNYSYIVTMTYAINDDWSYFIENQGVFKKTSGPDFHFGTGIAYLFSKNLQIDAAIRTNFFADYSFTYSSVGAAWRLDRHSDEIIDKSSPMGQMIHKRPKRHRTNFFSRIFKKNR